MKIAIFINNCPIQSALAYKINDITSIDSIFISHNIINSQFNNKSISYYFKRIVRVPFELPFRLAWNKLKAVYQNQHTILPSDIQQMMVDNINDLEVVEYIKKSKPKLIIVSATTMLKDEIINEANKIGCIILNLHTGVSPYIKGGPNCTNWCLASNYYLIGNTIMTLDSGIDSGAIIATELTILDGDESLFELHHKVFEHGFDLYTRVISSIVKNEIKIKAIPQNDISIKGNLFYTKDWTIFKVIQSYFNFLFKYKNGIKSFKLNNNEKLFPFINKIEKK